MLSPTGSSDSSRAQVPIRRVTLDRFIRALQIGIHGPSSTGCSAGVSKYDVQIWKIDVVLLMVSAFTLQAVIIFPHSSLRPKWRIMLISVVITQCLIICIALGAQVAAYASNLDDGPKITFCSPFWQYPNLDDKKTALDGTPSWQKNIGNMKSQGEIFLHEMTHLLVISGSRKIIDYKWPEGSARAYGPKLCEKLAKSSDNAKTWDAILNADNYAMFATGSWFFQWYGLPDSKYKSFADEDSYTPTTADEEGVDDEPIDENSFTVSTAYPASSGYTVDTAEVSDMLSWATILTNYKSRGPQPTTPSGMTTSVVAVSSSAAASAISSSVVAPPVSTAAPAPPTCTPDVECPDDPRPGGLGQRCRCTVCYCSDGSKQVCNINGKCVPS